MKPGIFRAPVDFGIGARRMAGFVVIKTDSDHFLATVGQNEIEKLHGDVWPQFAIDCRDQARVDVASRARRHAHPCGDAVKHRRVRYAVIKMWLRAEEKFHVARAAGSASRQCFIRDAMEIIGVNDGAADDVVGSEEFGEVGEMKWPENGGKCYHHLLRHA